MRRAHAAGDAENARKLSKYIASQQPTLSAPSGPVEQAIEKTADTAGNWITDAAGWVRDKFRGPQDLPEVSEFNPPMPGQGSTREPTRLDDSTIEAFGRRTNAALGTALTNNPAAREDIIREQYPGVRITPVQSDETGQEYKLAEWTDENGQVHKGYINAPGFTMRDAGALTAQGVAMLPAARFGAGGFSRMATGATVNRAPGVLTRAVKTGAGTALTDAALQKAVEPLGSKQGVDPGQIGVAGVAGGAAEFVAPAAASVARLVRGNKLISRGRLTPEGKGIARAAGLDPEDMSPAAQQEFARLVQTSPSDVAARGADLQDFNIRASRGQVGQDYQQLNLEDRMRRGLEGEEARRIIKEFDQGQQVDIDAAAKGVQQRLQPSVSDNVVEARQRFHEGFEAREQALSGKVDAAYANLRGLGDADIDVGKAPNLMQRVKDVLENQTRVVDKELTPGTVYALDQLEKRIAGTQGKAISVPDYEKARRVLNNAIRAAKSPEDKANVRIIKGELDRWLDDAVDAGLMSGDPAVVPALKNARAARVQYGKAFEQRGPNDKAGAIVNKVLNKAETPEEAMNFILGVGKLSKKTNAVGAAKRLKEVLGEESDAWNAVREAAWTRIARDQRGKPRTAAAFKTEWEEFQLNNTSMMNVLFKPEEINLMRRYGRALARTDAPPTNSSQSSFSIETAIRQVMRGMGARERIQGNIGSGLMLNFMSRMPLNPLGAADWAKRRAAETAISTLPSQRSVSPAAVAGFTAGTTQLDQGALRDGQ